MHYFKSIKKMSILFFLLLSVNFLSSCGNKKNITLEFDFKNNFWSNKEINSKNNFQGENS